MGTIDWRDREFGFLSEIRILEPLAAARPRPVLAPAAHHVPAPARRDLPAGRIAYWKQLIGGIEKRGFEKSDSPNPLRVGIVHLKRHDPILMPAP